MFDIGFLEILVILIIALMVIGPARMPEVARKIGAFTGKTKRFINSMKEDSEISDAIREVQASINIEDEKKQLAEISSDVQEDMQSIQSDWGIDEALSRPSFAQDDENRSIGNQFNKAPQQPRFPTETSAEQKHTADTDVVKENKASEIAEASNSEPETTDSKSTGKV